MAAGPRVDYLAGFCCPVGGLAAGRPRVLCHDGRIYLSNGSAFVYVYDQEGRLLQVSPRAALPPRSGPTAPSKEKGRPRLSSEVGPGCLARAAPGRTTPLRSAVSGWGPGTRRAKVSGHGCLQSPYLSSTT